MRLSFIEWMIVASGVIILSVVLSGGCGSPRPECHFVRGETVKTVLNEVRGQVVSVLSRQCLYFVRFQAPMEWTDTRIFSNDGSIKHSPFSIIKMREFELQKDSEGP